MGHADGEGERETDARMRETRASYVKRVWGSDMSDGVPSADDMPHLTHCLTVASLLVPAAAGLDRIGHK